MTLSNTTLEPGADVDTIATLDQACERLQMGKQLDAGLKETIERFKDAIKKSNPQLNMEQLGSYVECFSEEIPALTQLIRSEHLEDLVEVLSPEEVAALAEFSQYPGINIFLEAFGKTSLQLRQAVQKVMRLEGVVAHRRSLEQAFNTI